LNRLIRFAYANGVRYFDTADCYGTETTIGRWLQENPEVRKEIFLVTKDHPKTPRQLIRQLDQRLAALKVDHVDLFLIHGIGHDYGYASLQWPKSRELKETIAAIKKSGKARFVGFSSHDDRRAEYLQAAAEGGFVDAIMLQYTPWLDRDAPLNRALDACWKRGIGLISMKQVAGQENLLEVPQRAPALVAKGLTPFQALLHAIWTDERITTSCVSMRNLDQIRENTQAAARYAPLKQAEINELRDACLAAGPTFCADCDGRCARAAGTSAALGDLTRLLTYHEQYGNRSEARRLYSLMPEAERNWQDADLDAARQACPNRLDFATLLPRAQRHLA
jgi:predicted aldo/keto reductase-like oxidoreductase